MNILSCLFTVMFALAVSGCDKDQSKSTKTPKTQVRTVIIAGTPVSERDYQLSPHHVTAFNEAAIDEDGD